MNRISNRIKAGSIFLSVVMLFWFIGINTVNAATEYTPLVHKDDYDFTVNSGAIEEWFTVSPDDVVSSVLSVASKKFSAKSLLVTDSFIIFAGD